MTTILKNRKRVVNLSWALFTLILVGSGCEKSTRQNIISTEFNKVKQVVKEVEATLDQKEKELEELQAALDQKETVAEAVQANVDQKEKELEELQAALDQKETVAEAVQANVDQKEKELEELQAALDQKETELNDLKNQLTEATKEEEVYIIVPQGEIFMRQHGAPPYYGARLDISYKSANGNVVTKSLSHDVCLIVKQSEFASKIQKIEAYTTVITKYTICDNTTVDSAGDDTASAGDDTALKEDGPTTLCVPAHYTVMSTGTYIPNHRDIWVANNVSGDKEGVKARHEKYIEITYPIIYPDGNTGTSSHILRIVRDKIINTFIDRENCLSEVVL
ncbi:MAG: hypothetical protein OXM55_04550 [Bdellovibrionales bacterium]|nr:hypothetical protein [Bdellovibrionales bacterium]